MKFFKKMLFLIIVHAFILLAEMLNAEDIISSELLSLCNEGDVYHTYDILSKALYHKDSRALHIISALELMLYSNITAAVEYHQLARLVAPSVAPPLLQISIKQQVCGGLGKC